MTAGETAIPAESIKNAVKELVVTDVAFGEEISVAFDAVVEVEISSPSFTDSKIVDVGDYFNTKKAVAQATVDLTSLKDYIKQAATAFAKSRDDSFSSDMEARLSEFIDAMDLGSHSVKPEYRYDYQDKVAETKFNVKMSDIRGQDTRFTNSIAKTDTPNKMLIYGVSSYVYTDDGDDMRAVKFADGVRHVNIDLENKSTNLTYMYAGGVVANNADITLSNANTATLSGGLSTDGPERNALKESALIKALKTSSELPTFEAWISAFEPGLDNTNLYGTGVDKVIDNYYANGAKNKMKVEFESVKFNAKAYLDEQGTSMFNGNTYTGKAYPLSANAAALMLRDSTHVSNVAITGTNDTGVSELNGNMINIYTTTDWSGITKVYGSLNGILYFLSKPPSTTDMDGGAKWRGGFGGLKIVFASRNSDNRGAIYKPAGNSFNEIDISNLSIEEQQHFINMNYQRNFTIVRYSSGISAEPTAASGMNNVTVFIGNTAKGMTRYNFTNKAWEVLGNKVLDGTAINSDDVTILTENSKVSRLDKTSNFHRWNGCFSIINAFMASGHIASISNAAPPPEYAGGGRFLSWQETGVFIWFPSNSLRNGFAWNGRQKICSDRRL